MAASGGKQGTRESGETEVSESRDADGERRAVLGVFLEQHSGGLDGEDAHPWSGQQGAYLMLYSQDSTLHPSATSASLDLL